jgi:hypothetical protein
MGQGILIITIINKNAMFLNGLGKKGVEMQLNRLKFTNILVMVLNVVRSCDSFLHTYTAGFSWFESETFSSGKFKWADLDYNCASLRGILKLITL